MKQGTTRSTVGGRFAAREGADLLANRLALRPKEAAEALGVSPRTLRKWMRDDALPYFRVDGTVRICVVDLQRWMADRMESQRNVDAIVDEVLRDL